MALFRKPKKNVRPRGQLSIADVDLYDDESEDPSLAEIHNNISKLKEKKKDKDKKKREKTKEERKVPLLSFEDDLEGDDGEEVFKIKKSSASRRLRKQKEKERKDGELCSQSSPQPQEHATNGSNGSNGNNGNKAVVIDDDLDIVAVKDNGANKQDKGRSWTLTGKEAEALHLEEEDDTDNEDVVDVEDGYDPLKKIIQAGGIPDAVAIHAARKKREAMRARGGEEEYIPVRKSNTNTNTGKRLVREEDQEEEDEERISFTIKESKKEDDYHRHAQADQGSDSDNDHWEAQQIRKAVTQNQISYAATEKYTDSLAGLPHPPLPPVISLATSSPLPQPPRGPPPLARPVQYNLPGIRDRMKQRLVEMEEVSRRHGQDADRAVDELVSSECEIERLESSIPGLAQKHRFYQDLRGYVTDFTDCFDEKVGSIAYLEERLYKMYAELRGKIRERRRQDVRDQADQLHSMTATNIALMMDPVQDAVRDFRVAEREGRRMRRRQARQARSEMRHNDGMSSDDEIPSTDKASLGKVRQDVENQARQVLDDVIEEFALLSNVQTRLSSWKLEDFSSYKEAYVSLCLPKLFSPLIRMQLLLWNPFVHEQKIEDQEWYRTLSSYGLQEGETMESLGTDPDRNLLSLCVERVLVPKLVGLVKSGYDPLSHSQTLRLVALVSRLAADYPTLTPTSKHLRQLVTTVVDNIKESLDSDVYIPVYNKAQLDSPSSPHAAFSHRQFWTTYKLLRNILAWQGVLADGVLADLAIDRLINRYVLLSLRANPDISDAIDKSRQVVALLPPWWLNKGCEGQLSRLAMFVKFLGVAGATNNLPRDALIEAARIVKLLGDSQTSDSLRELL